MSNTKHIDYSKWESRPLSPTELMWVRELIAETPPGHYTLPELHGEGWQCVPRKQAFGKWFKTSVLAGLVEGVSWILQRPDKKNLYHVHHGVK